MASKCHNEGICHTCNKSRHRARDCTAAKPLPLGDMRLCNNCYKQTHMAADYTNEKACNNCRKTGYLARDCPNKPICNMCNISRHVARQCPKAHLVDPRGGIGGAGRSFRDVVCRSCGQMGHMSRDCMAALVWSATTSGAAGMRLLSVLCEGCWITPPRVNLLQRATLRVDLPLPSVRGVALKYNIPVLLGVSWINKTFMSSVAKVAEMLAGTPRFGTLPQCEYCGDIRNAASELARQAEYTN